MPLSGLSSRSLICGESDRNRRELEQMVLYKNELRG
jgi:hypothetical protein